MSERLKSSLPGYLSFSTALFGPNVGFLHCTLWIMKARSLLSSAAGNAVPVPAGKDCLFSFIMGLAGSLPRRHSQALIMAGASPEPMAAADGRMPRHAPTAAVRLCGRGE
jgi:hypothetical protein